MPAFDSMKIHPMTFIQAMSSALELSSTGISQHHRRTATIAGHIGAALQFNQADMQVLFYSSLLHDIGAAANWDEKHHIVHKVRDHSIYHHAERGYEILKQSQQLSILAEPIRYHHDRYHGGNPSGLSGKDIPLISRIIHLADRIEVQIKPDVHIFQQRKQILEEIKTDTFFDPDLVQTFLEIGQREYFWLDIVNPSSENHFLNDYAFFGKFLFTVEDMITMAEIFSQVVDSTSHYTAAHSRNVATVAEQLAGLRGFSGEECRFFYLAGLLHDIGKLAIPNEILNKRDKLTEEEIEIIHQHPYYSQRILEQIEGFEKIAHWVGTHHETLNGQGYPYRLDKKNIDLGSRILAVSDIFCALVENRPYRPKLTMDDAFEIIDNMVHRERLDGSIVEDIRSNRDQFYRLIVQYQH